MIISVIIIIVIIIVIDENNDVDDDDDLHDFQSESLESDNPALKTASSPARRGRKGRTQYPRPSRPA